MTTRTFALNILPGNGGTIPFLNLAIGCGGKHEKKRIQSKPMSIDKTLRFTQSRGFFIIKSLYQNLGAVERGQAVAPPLDSASR